MNDIEPLYREKVAETYNKLVLTGLPERDPRLNNIALEHIFVKLTIAVESATPFQSVFDLPAIRPDVEADEDSERLPRRRFEREQIAPPKPIPIATALHQYRRLIMTGAPGSGKTTLLRWLAVTFAQRQQADESRLGAAFTEETLPILLELRRFAQRFHTLAENPAPFDLAQEISAYIGADPRFYDVSEEWMREALAQQPCLLLLDGLDEIADRSTRQRLLEALEAFIKIPTYAHVRCILTTRPHGFQDVNIGTAFQRTEVRPFTSDDVAQFIQHWYATAYDPEYQTEAQELIAAIQAQERVTALAQNPLLCTIIAIIYRNNRVLPNRRVELYLKCCEALLDTWERNKNIKDSGLIGGFDWQTKLELLMPVAYWFHQHSEQLAMPKEAVVQQLAQALKELRKNSGLDSANKPPLQEAREFIVAIRDRSGLLQGRGDGTLEFSHRTFQEYLAARYIAAQPDPVYIDIVMAHLHEAWWREVHLLVIGHLGSGRDNAEKATRLMLTILKVYKAPNRGLLYPILLFNLGRWLPRLQWQKRIAWHLMREFELVAQGYADCAIGARTQKLSRTLSDLSVKRISQWLYNPLYQEQLAFLLTTLAQQNLPRDAVVDIVLKGLKNNRRWVRRAAVKRLGQLGQGNDSVIAALLKALLDEDNFVRYSAASSLGQLGQRNESVISALLKALQDEEWVVRRAAAESLGQLGQGNDSVISALLKALQDEDDSVRRAAAESLGQLGQGNDSVISAILKALQDKDDSVRSAAAESLGQLGQGNESVIAALLKALQDEDDSVRRTAAFGLCLLGQGNESVIAALLKALQDESDWVRGTAASSLGKLGQGNESVISALLKALQDEEWVVRRAAAESLGQLGQGNDSVISALLKALQDEVQYVRSAAAESLGQLGQGNESVISALLRALQDEDDSVRSAAAESLGQLGQGNDSVISALLKALQHEEWIVRRAAAESLGQLGQGNESVIAALLKALQDEEWVVRRAASSSLGQLGQGNDSVIAALLKALLDQDEDVRRAAAESLGQLGQGNDLVISGLLKALQDEEYSVQSAAASSLGQLGQGNDSVISALLKALQDKNEEVRRAAALSLEQLGQGNEYVIELSLKALQDKDEQVRWDTANSLGKLKIEDEIQLRPVLIALTHRIHDSNKDVSDSAFESLRKLLDGRPIPGYRWKPLAKREQRQKIRGISLSALLVLLIVLFLVFQMPIVAAIVGLILGIVVGGAQLGIWIKEWLQK